MADIEKVEFIESYKKIGNGDYRWNDNHGELIRCKDCKWYKDYCCTNVDFTWYREPNWFCADGERRTDDG